MVSFYLVIFAYRANDPEFLSPLLGFIIAYIFSYVGYYYWEKIKRVSNSTKIGKQLLVLLLLFIILIIVLLFKLLVMSLPGDPVLSGDKNLFLLITFFVFFGVPLGCGIGIGLGIFLKGIS